MDKPEIFTELKDGVWTAAGRTLCSQWSCVGDTPTEALRRLSKVLEFAACKAVGSERDELEGLLRAAKDVL